MPPVTDPAVVAQLNAQVQAPPMGGPTRRVIEGPPRLPNLPPGQTPEQARGQALLNRQREQAIAKAERDAAREALNPPPQQAAMDAFDRAIQSTERLYGHPGVGPAVGRFSLNPRDIMGGRLPGYTMSGTDAANFEAQLESLRAQVFLPMVQALRGMGQLSNMEGQRLTDAIGALHVEQGETAFRESLVRIRNDLQRYRARSQSRLPQTAQPAAQPSQEDERTIALAPPGTHVEFGPNAGGGGPDRWTPEQAARFDNFVQSHPNATAEQIVEFGHRAGLGTITNADDVVRARPGGMAPGSSARAVPPDISDVRGADADPRALMVNEATRNADPMLGPLFRSATGVLGSQGGDAFHRGFVDVPTMSLSGEIAGAVTGNIGREDAIDRYDEENNFGSRLGGQILGGFALPGGSATSLGRNMLVGAGYGGAYGFGAGEGGAVDRLPSAAVGATIGAAVPLALRGVGVGRGPNVNRNALIEAADRQQVPITRLEAGGVGSRMAGGVVGRTLGEIPLVAGSRASAEGSEIARDRIAGTMGILRDEVGAGQAAQRGMRSFLANSKERGQQLLARIPIPAERPAELAASRAALTERTAGMESNAMLGEMFRDPRLEGYLAALEGRASEIPTGILDAQGNAITRTVQEGGGLSWGDMRRFRSLVGEMIEQPTVGGEGTATAALRRLYGGLSQDMEATAAQVSPRALTAVRRYNQYWRGREGRREGIVSDVLGPNFDASPQAAFDQINRWAQRKGGDFARVGQALRSMPAEEANSVRASFFGRMGRAKAGRQDETGEAFSPAEFATQWANLNPRARQFLAPEASHRNALNDLVRITNAQKRSSGYQNFSMTSLGTNAVAFFTGLAYAPIPTLAVALGSLGAGKFLASPAATRWALRAASTRSPRTFIQGLTGVAKRDPAIAQEALGLRRYLLSVANDNLAQPGTLAASPPSEGPDNADQ